MKHNTELIPIPPAQRLRMFRRLRLPVIIFAAGVAGVCVLWQKAAVAPSLVAEAEVACASLSPLQAGRVSGLHADELMQVRKGQVLAVVTPLEPELAERSLRVLRSQIEQIKAGGGDVLDSRRLMIDSERLRIEWMKSRVELAEFRVKQQLAEADLVRAENLRGQQIVSDASYEATRSLRDRLVAQVAEQEKLVASTQSSLEKLSRPEAGAQEGPEQARELALRVAEEQLLLLEAQQRPAELRAPMDGVVSKIWRRTGEVVRIGEPVLTVTATQSHRLVAYARQPLMVDPRKGQSVEIRSRKAGHPAVLGRVLEVGAALEPVPPSLVPVVLRSAVPENGLRVHLSMPEGLQLHPGEQVDVILRD